jgi:hypothetical protein
MEATCTTCGKGTQGYKCVECGVEGNAHDPAHACGAEKHMPKCAACNEAQAKCTC